jgi:hypothetical protein
MTTRQRNALLLAGVLALSATGIWLFAPKAHAERAVDAIPDGAFLLATIDLAKLRESPFASDLAGLSDVNDVARACGFDPLSRATTIAIGVPEKPDGVFGLAITTQDLSKDELVHCAERVMSARSATPRVALHGSWTELEQEGVIAQATRAKIAYRKGSPLLVARGDYLATMQSALDGDRARAKDVAEHAALRKAAQARVPNAVILITGILPKSVRERIKEETQTMAAVLAVKAFGLAAAPSAAGDMLDVFAELDCESASACATLRDFLERKAKAVPLVDLRLETHESTLTMTVSISAIGAREELARVLRGGHQ